jgi:hypothetical protein
MPHRRRAAVHSPVNAGGGRILFRDVRKVEDLPATFAGTGRDEGG